MFQVRYGNNVSIRTSNTRKAASGAGLRRSAIASAQNDAVLSNGKAPSAQETPLRSELGWLISARLKGQPILMPKECSRTHWLHRRQQKATTWRTPGALWTYQWAPTPLASGTKPRPRAATREAGVPLKRHAPAQTRTPSPCRRTVRTHGTAPRENRTHKPRDDTQSDGNHKMSRNIQ